MRARCSPRPPFLPPRYNNLKVRFPTQSEATVLLLNLLLTYDPSRRIDAATALAHPYFSELPMRMSARPRPYPTLAAYALIPCTP